MILSLSRDTQTAECTLGILEVAGRKFHTIERPWIPNPDGGKSGKKYESCVAPGVYRLERWNSIKFGQVFILSNPVLDVYMLPSDVPKGREAATRTLVLIHVGNYVHDVIGCVAVGKERVKTAREWMVQRSKEAMNEVRMLVGTRVDLSLVITGGAGGGT